LDSFLGPPLSAIRWRRVRLDTARNKFFTQSKVTKTRDMRPVETRQRLDWIA
jgi:hypothetical protein